MEAAVSRLHFPVTTLGPGERVGLWLQGCSIRCPGCISVDTWEPGIGRVSLGELLEKVSGIANKADGLTVSGGEPFEQPQILSAVLRRWREVSKSSVLVFTGRELDEISPWLAEHAGLVDAIITGRFRSDLPQTLALRGSDNQRLYVLSELGTEFLAFNRPVEPGDRRFDVMFDERGDVWLAGIPARGDLGRLRRALASAGHRVHTSDEIGGMAR
jgi:anaerobic ribonucleoside-triphosphate reductase activating protein